MTIHLVVPALLGPLPGKAEPEPKSRTPLLESFLAQADQVPAPVGYAETLFHLFGIPAQLAADLPTASLCYLADAAEKSAHFLFHADPVHLRPDMDRLLLFDAHGLEITDQQAAQFATAFNQHFAADGIQLLTPVADRWYLQVDTAPDIRTSSLVDVIGRNIDMFLPTGADADQWCKLLTEVQMLFHGLAVNTERESQGMPAINSVWFSGGGALPGKLSTDITTTFGDCALLRGMAELASISNLANEAVNLITDESICVMHTSGRAVLQADYQAWLESFEEIENLLGHLMRSGSALFLYPCDGMVYQWQPKMRRRFWRRKKSLFEWMN